MFAPLIMITTHSVDPDKVEQAMEISSEYIRFVRKNEPAMLIASAALNEDRTEITLMHALGDTAAADHHLQLVQEHIGRGLTVTETTRILVVGEPGPALASVLAGNADGGATVAVWSDQVAAFARMHG